MLYTLGMVHRFGQHICKELWLAGLKFWHFGRDQKEITVLAFLRYIMTEILSEFWANRAKVDTIDEKSYYIDYEISTEQICSMTCFLCM